MNLQAFRRKLHQQPELSHQELHTAQLIVDFLTALKPDQLLTEVGGTGVIAVFKGTQAGQSVLFRCELDALPIQEANTFAHRSQVDGVSHLCGHDGHMTIICGLAEKLAANRHFSGQRLLLFQPAEETGAGALAIVDDPQFKALTIDACYALHNLPGVPLGHIQIRSGTFNCASRGMSVTFAGESVHAAYPEQGKSPAPAMNQWLEHALQFKPHNAEELQMVTLVFAQLGQKSFGTTAAQAEIAVTLRAASNQGMQQMVTHFTQLSETLADQHQLKLNIEWHDIFKASVNDEGCAQKVAEAAKSLQHQVEWLDEPLRWSEDFGAISEQTKGAMFVLGSGENTPQLHSVHYDFPDALIEQGMAIFLAISDSYN
jgi:amidohydrolase